MKRSNIKDTFGNEVTFTKHIANNKVVADRLLEVIDGIVGDYVIEPEDQTVDNKRVDLVVRDEDGNVVSVIESQDASGWLDSIHSSKITYYCYEKGCMDAVLITEDADEHIKGFVKWLNENTPLNIWLLSVVIYQYGEDNLIDFIPLMRPFSRKQKKITSNPNNLPDWYETNAEFLQEKFEEHKGYFTNVTRYYVSKNNIANKGVNAGIKKRKNYYKIDLYHRNKYDNKEFKDSFKALFEDASFDRNSGYVTRETWEDALSINQQIVDNVVQGKIVLVGD